MKFTNIALLSAVAASSFYSEAAAFTPATTGHSSSLNRYGSCSTAAAATGRCNTSSLQYSVGIVGATGAVGKEIRQVLEDRGKLAVDQLRIFGSSRSAGTKVETKYGTVQVELFNVEAARQCDVVFLAVDGDFALENAKKICEGDDGAVVIDNSVSWNIIFFVAEDSLWSFRPCCSIPIAVIFGCIVFCHFDSYSLLLFGQF